MLNWITTALVYDTVVCGKETTCLLKFIGGHNTEELNLKRIKAQEETGIMNLRFDDTVELH